MPIDGAEIQRRVNRGFAIAGAKTGVPHDLFRPSGVRSPLGLRNRIVRGLPAALDARPSYKFSAPALHGEPVRYALVDADLVQTGDYLVGPQETVFVAAKPHMQAIICVACNAVLSMSRRADPGGFGGVDAGPGDTLAFEGWPAGFVHVTARGADEVNLPGDAPPPSFTAYLPAISGVAHPRGGDVVTDADGDRYAVQWGEATSLGWRFQLRLLVAG